MFKPILMVFKGFILSKFINDERFLKKKFDERNLTWEILLEVDV